MHKAMTRIRTLLPLVVAGLVFSGLQAASACAPRKICVYWGHTIIDDEFGDYELGEEVRARGAKVTHIPPAPEPPLSTFLDQEGCLTFETQFAYGHKLVVYNEAWVGSLDPEQLVHIRATRQEVSMGEIGTEFKWVVPMHGFAPNDEVKVVVRPEELTPIVPLMALATAVMHRFHELDVLPPSPATLEVRFLDYYGNARLEHNGLITVGPDSYEEKFLLAHEMGHWLQRNWNGFFAPFDYSYGNEGEPRVPDAPCQFVPVGSMDLMGKKGILSDSNRHGIRSAEWSGGAMSEGFAHFVAAIVFNDTADGDGIFRYYKEINIDDKTGSPLYKDFVQADKGNYRVSLFGDQLGCDPCPVTLGGENRWTWSQCSYDWINDGVSTGMDWMRFFWHFTTRPGTAPTLRQLLEFFKFAKENDKAGHVYNFNKINIWPKMREALGGSALADFEERFDQANCDMGVYNGNTCPP